MRLLSLLLLLVPGLLVAGEAVLLAPGDALGADREAVLRLEGAGPPRPDGTPATLWLTCVQRAGALAGPPRLAVEINERTRARIAGDGLAWTGERIAGALAIRQVGVDPFKPPKPEDLAKRLDQAPAIALDLDAALGADATPWQVDPAPSMPPWRKEVPRPGGWAVTGTWRAGAASGAIAGGWRQLPGPGLVGSEGTARIAAAADGWQVACVLAPKRVAAPEGARLLRELPAPIDLAGHAGLAVEVTGGEDRPAVRLSVRLRTVGGTWWGDDQAIPLRRGRAVETIPFARFRHVGGFNDYLFHRDRVDAVAIGCDDPRGVGELSFTVHRIAAVGAADAAPGPLAIRLRDAWLDHDGATAVPKGLFGLHDVNGPAKDRGNDELLRRIKPGTLRFVEHTGFGASKPSKGPAKAWAADDPKRPATAEERLARAAAADAVDGWLPCHSWDLWRRPPWMDAGIAATAEQVRAFYAELAARAWTPGDDGNLLRQVEVFNEPFIWGRHINLGARLPKGAKDIVDPAQYGYLPGPVGADAWADLFAAAHAGARSASPHLQLVGPSAPGFNEDFWDPWTTYIARMVDRSFPLLAAITEHHYQGEPAVVAAGYVLAGAWCEVRHGRRLPIWNTETNDLTDTPTKGDGAAPPPWSADADRRNRAHYNALDILTLIATCPDLAQRRAIHAMWAGGFRNQGEQPMLEFLAPLRGRLVAVESAGDVLAVAASPQPGRVEVVAIDRHGRGAAVRLEAPPGWRVAASDVLDFLPGPPPATAGAVAPREVRIVAAAPAADGRLPPLLMQRWTLEGPEPAATAVRRSRFSDLLVRRVAPDAPVEGVAPLPAAGAARAWLRVVANGVRAGDAEIAVNGHPVPLPWMTGNPGAEEVHDLPIDPAWLGERNRIVATSARDGWLLVCAGLLVEGERR